MPRRFPLGAAHAAAICWLRAIHTSNTRLRQRQSVRIACPEALAEWIRQLTLSFPSLYYEAFHVPWRP